MMEIAGNQIPQANRLDLVIAGVEAVSQGARTDVEISDYLSQKRGKPSDEPGRDGRYYRLSGKQLGLITNDANNATLTDLGQRFMAASDEEKQNILLNAVLGLKIFRALIPFYEQHSSGVTREQLVKFISSISKLSQNTVERRLSSILRWLRDIDVIEEKDGVSRLKGALAFRIPIVEFRDSDEPILPRSLGLKEYAVISNRSENAADEIQVRVNAAKRERANQAHTFLTNTIADRIRRSGSLPRSNRYIDVAAQIDQVPYIFEMKSISDSNAQIQIRMGLSQLYEYRYLQNLPDATLVLVIERELPTRVLWMQDYLEADRRILLVWDGDGQLYASRATQQRPSFLW